MTGVRLSLRVFNNLQFYTWICRKSGSFTYSTSQCSTCWTHQRHLSTYLTNYSRSANGLFSAISGGLQVTPPGTNCFYNCVRHKSKKSQKKKNKHGGTKEDDEDEDEEEIDPEDISDYEDEPKEDPAIIKDYKDVEKAVQSFRFDVIFTAGLDMARNKVEDAFYDGKLRLNGEKLWKKSRAVKVGDVLDLVLEDNRDITTVMRAILMEVHKEKTSTDKHKVVLRRWKRLIVKKTPDAPQIP